MKTLQTLIKNSIKQENKEEALAEKKPDIIGFFLAPLFVLIMLEIMHLSSSVVEMQFFKNTDFLAKWVVSYLFLLFTQGVLMVIIPNLAVSNTIMTVVFFIMGLINEAMVVITADPLLPSDFFLAGNMGEIAGFVEIPYMPQCIFAFIVGGGSIAYFFVRRKRFKTKLTIKQRIAFSVAAVMLFSTLNLGLCFDSEAKTKFLQKLNVSIAAFNPISDYYDNGFILTFFPRIGQLIIEKPEGYGEDKINEIKDSAKPVESLSDVKPNIIAIQSEAFWDITMLPETAFTSDPMKNIRRITAEENAKLGTFVSPVFGGGTCMPEFEFLTGYSIGLLPPNVYPYIQVVRDNTPSFISNYKANGYETYALHPYKKNFYERDTAYPRMGFDTFLGDEDLENAENRGFYISDMTVTKELIKAFENKKSDRIFEFSVTMQNHGDYCTKRYASYDVLVENPHLNEADMLGVTEFTQGVFDADVAFNELVEYFKTVDEPTIIVMYGDHLPLLGSSGSTFFDAGYITKQGENFYATSFPELHETSYIVWANYDVDLSGFDDTLSAANLGLTLFKYSGIKDIPWYYSAIDRFYEKYPVFTPLIAQDNDLNVVDTNNKEFVKLAEIYENVQYDLTRGKRYSLK